MIREVLQESESRMRGAIRSLEEDLSGYRTGRASPQLIERLVVEVYGSEMTLNQLALISVPEPQQLAIRPFDTRTISQIEKAILKSDLGLNPNNDGKIIRLNIPSLTEERRRSLQKQVHKRVEEAKVAVRNVRRDAVNDLREFKEAGEITEDELHRGQDDLQKLTDKVIGEIDTIGRNKEAEIMEV